LCKLLSWWRGAQQGTTAAGISAARERRLRWGGVLLLPSVHAAGLATGFGLPLMRALRCE
jgi:hypothetical protein